MWTPHSEERYDPNANSCLKEIFHGPVKHSFVFEAVMYVTNAYGLGSSEIHEDG